MNKNNKMPKKPTKILIVDDEPDIVEILSYNLAKENYEIFKAYDGKQAVSSVPLAQHCGASGLVSFPIRAPAASLQLLSEWEAELDACYTGHSRHPVFVALSETIKQFDIPKRPFADLLKAFRQDQTVTRYPTFNDLLGYCENSANPVGRLVLYVCGYRDPERQALSDFTCTALQLANFWQDVSADWNKGRIYVPLEDLRRFGVSEQDIAESRNSEPFREMMKFEVKRAREWFRQGLPLIKSVDRSLALDIELFSRGGQEILSAIERQGFAVLGRRPAISKTRKLALVARAALGKLL